jgi:fused signal recognition particle receptor
VFGRLFRRQPKEERVEKIEESVQKTRASFFSRVSSLLSRGRDITPELWDELEEILISGDVGVETTESVLDRLRELHKSGVIGNTEELNRELQDSLIEILDCEAAENDLLPDELTVVLVIGVNGVGKTTSIAKLGNYWREMGRSVILAAGDTFRAAGVEQLEVWADRTGLPCIGSQTGADPGSIVYDAIAAAKARGHDLVIVDTAGRLHTKANLMEELRKIRRIIDRHQVATRSLMVLDATTGQNAIVQARSFADAAGLDGVVVTKLDGTAKGGMVFSIVKALGAPVRFIGTGEKVQDLSEFDAEDFVHALFGEPARA